MTTYKSTRRIHLLRGSVARKIAAGEVIDRPFSVLRELLDNSIDAGASNIDVYITGGGIDSIRVVDDGSGMDREDIKLCVKSHATSKINHEDDLYALTTLGFRGEALCSIAAVSRLEITSGVSGENHRLLIHGGKEIALTPIQGKQGTILQVGDLFYNLPGRRKFLKKASAETSMCRNTFIEKALPFPEITFRLFIDGSLKYFLPPSDPTERIVQIFPRMFTPPLLHEHKRVFDSFTVRFVAGSPSLSRRDRRYIQVFVNKRRIQEYSLMQAVEYGYSEYLPGGSFPVCFLFLEIAPELVDFNIHPAKREVKFRNLAEIHRRIVETVKEFLSPFSLKADKPRTPGDLRKEFSNFLDFSTGVVKEKAPPVPGYRGTLPPFSNSRENKIDPVPLAISEKAVTAFRYLGQVFNLFLLAEREGKLFMVDQHAAHERILFNEIREGRKSPQQLLVPREFEVEDSEDRLIREQQEIYRDLGIILTKTEQETWVLKALPAACLSMEGLIIDFLKTQRGSFKELEQELYATLSCKGAIKDGEVLDEISATNLLEQTFALENARCPHGRPVWFVISREELFQLVGRT